MHINRQDVWHFVKDMVLINLGMAVYAIGWVAFLLPYRITTGGMSGMAAILQYATGFPMQYTIFIVNMVLLVIAWWQLGAKFAIKTLYAVLFLSFYLDLWQNLMTDTDGSLLKVLGDGQDSMAVILGSVLNGIGIAFAFMGGGSTGGWDIVAAVVNKYRNISLGNVMLFLDFFVISSCWFIFHDWRMVVFGFVALVVYTFTFDTMLNSNRQDIQITVYTHKHEEVRDIVRDMTGHTCTLMYGQGGYSTRDMKVVVTIVHKREAVKILRAIRNIDQEAFITQHRVEGVYGLGFNAIKG